MDVARVQSWFAHGQFKEADYVTPKLEFWPAILDTLKGKDGLSILEIGSMEGRSALFFLNYFPESRITCVDPFFKDRSEIFDRNLAPHASRLEKIRSYSFDALRKLRAEKREFDLIYIDGSHKRETVILDSTLCWPMLKVGGILIWDDYGYYKASEPPADRPKQAIDGFLVAFADEYEELYRYGQLIVRKTVECPRGNLSPRIAPKEKRKGLIPKLKRRLVRMLSD